MTMQEDLMELARLKEMQRDLADQVLEVEMRLVEALEKKGQKTVSANNGDLNGTLVKGTTVSINEEALKKALGAPLWKKVTKQVLDKERLEAHIVTGEVDPNVVASVSTEKDRKPFIKVTGTFRTKKAAAKKASASVTTRNSAGGTKPAAKKRAVRPAKKTARVV